MKVAFTANAINRLQNIHAYISADSPENANRLVDRIIRRAETLAEQPAHGRIVPEYERDDVREIGEPPFRIVYAVKADRIRILTVMHERQLLPGDLTETS